MVSVLIPAHNEEALIAGSIEKLHQTLSREKITHELVVVENGSTDQTKTVILRLQKQIPRLRLLTLPVANYGEALKAGIVQTKGEIVTIVNVDFWDLGFIKSSLTEIEKGADLVTGSKFLGDDRRNFLKKFGSAGFNFLLRLLFNFKGTDTHGLKSFRRDKVFPLLNVSKTSDFVFDTELVLRVQRANLAMKELPVTVREVRPRRYSSAIQLMKTVQNLGGLIWSLGLSPNWSYLLLFLALAIGAFLRFYHYYDWFFFSVDEEHYSYMTRMITVDHHFPLIGGPISGTRLYMAPWFLYFNAIWFWLSANNPVASGAIFALLGLCVVYLVYLIGKKIFSPRAGAVAAFLYGSSMLMALFDRHYWNITLVPFLSALTFYALLKYLDGSKRWLITAAGVVGFGLSTNFSVFAVFLFAVLVIFLHRKRDLLFFFAVVGLFHVPLIFFDLRHNFWLLRALGDLLTIHSLGNVPLSWRVVNMLWLFLGTMGKAMVITRPLDLSDEISICTQGAYHYVPVIWSAVVAGAVVILSFFWLWRRSDKTSRTVILLALVDFISLFLFRTDASERHFLPFLPVFFVIFGGVLSKLGRAGLVFAALLAIVNIYSLANSYASYGLPKKIAAVKEVIANTEAGKFYLEGTGGCQEWGYRYWFSYFNHEPAASYLDETFSWMYSQPPDPRAARVKATVRPGLKVSLEPIK